MNPKDIHIEELADHELAVMLVKAKYWEVKDPEDFPRVNAWLMEGKRETPLTGDLASVSIKNLIIPNILESGTARVRIYTPADKGPNTGIIVFFRGSGFCTGEAWLQDEICASLALQTDNAVVSSDYRLAPMHHYPAAFNDAYSALVWADANRVALGIRGHKLVLIGMSAGGGLAVSAALKARDDNGPHIDLLCPLYPMLDPWNRGESNRRIISGYVWDGDKNGKGWQAYLGSLLEQDILPYTAAPLCAESFSGIPPVFTTIGQLDALQDEWFDFVRRCSADGVDVEFHYYSGAFHAFEANYPQAALSQHARSTLYRKLHEIKYL